jgi:hypothetical protein
MAELKVRKQSRVTVAQQTLRGGLRRSAFRAPVRGPRACAEEELMLRDSHLALFFSFFLAMVSGLSFSAQPARASLPGSRDPSAEMDVVSVRSFVPPAHVHDQAQVSAALRSAPVMFIENVGQFDAGARFQVRGGQWHYLPR